MFPSLVNFLHPLCGHFTDMNNFHLFLIASIAAIQVLEADKALEDWVTVPPSDQDEASHMHFIRIVPVQPSFMPRAAVLIGSGTTLGEYYP